MLVLTRKQGEELVINDDIIVTVVSCGNGRVRLGVKAPQHISVDRAEIHERKMEFVDIEPTASLGTAFARLMSKSSLREREHALPLKSR